MPAFPAYPDRGHVEHVSLGSFYTLSLLEPSLTDYSFVLGLQTIVILPLSAEPRTIRAPLLLIARSVDWLLSSRRHANGWQDLEKAALNTERVKGTMPTLQSLFQEEGIAASLASNLHYIDVTNVALASKATHRSVFNPVGTDASARHEQLCEKACAGTWKLECWACTRVICKVRPAATSPPWPFADIHAGMPESSHKRRPPTDTSAHRLLLRSMHEMLPDQGPRTPRSLPSSVELEEPGGPARWLWSSKKGGIG